MSARAVREELPNPVLARREDPAALATRRPGPVVAVSLFGQCGCPGECDRDHDNE
jgi:hypothetical protein